VSLSSVKLHTDYDKKRIVSRDNGKIGHLYRHSDFLKEVVKSPVLFGSCKQESVGWSYDCGEASVETTFRTVADYNIPLGPSRAYGAEDIDPFLASEMKQKLLLKLKDRKALIALTLLERASTAELIIGLAKDIAKGFSYLKRGKIKQAMSLCDWDRVKKYTKEGLMRAPDRISNEWMRYRYGITPTLMDVEGIAQQFAASRCIPKWLLEHSACVIENQPHYKTVLRFNGTRTPIGTLDRIYGDFTVTREQKHTYAVLAEVITPEYKTLTEWGLSDVGLTIWEMVPFSFVGNWFMNIGEYLDASSALNGLTVHDFSYTKTRHEQYLFNHAWTPKCSKMGGSDGDYMYKSRTLLPDGLLVDFVPALFGGLSPLHTADSVAMLRQLSR
jgi:hypothetical protein